MHWRRLACLVWLGVAASTIVPTSAALGQVNLYGAALDAEELVFLSLINSYRASKGVPPLQLSGILSGAAAWMAADGTAHALKSHIDSLGRDPCERLHDAGYPTYPTSTQYVCGGAWVGEASRWGGLGTALDAFNWWKGSAPHNDQMLQPAFKVIGIGRAYGASGWYWITDFGSVVVANDTAAVDPPVLPPDPPAGDGTPTEPDRVRPSIALAIEGLPGTTVTAHRGESLVIDADATDNEGVGKVQIRINDKLVCELTAVPYTCAWTVPIGETKKLYTIRGKVFDTSNNIRISTPLKVQIAD